VWKLTKVEFANKYKPNIYTSEWS